MQATWGKGEETCLFCKWETWEGERKRDKALMEHGLAVVNRRVCMVPCKWEEGLVRLHARGVAVGPYKLGFKVGQSIGLRFFDLSKYTK